MQLKIATETCSRCGGTGRMPFSVYGGRCFRCHGDGSTYTRAGKRIAAKVAEIRAQEPYSVKASDLVPGDQVFISEVTMGGDVYQRVVRVESLGEPETRAAHILPDGTQEPIWHLPVHYTCKGAQGTYHAQAETMLRRALSKEQKQEIYATLAPKCKAGFAPAQC